MCAKEISFVILHYNVIDETKKCIQSIKSRIDVDSYAIIVVDNKSPNGSGKILADLYANDPNITILLNEKNDGFARGNNIGFQFAKGQLKSKFIVLLNNDTYLIQNNFYNIVFKEYEKSHFAVLGPKIITILGDNSNPVVEKIQDLRTVKKQIWHHRFGLWRTYLGLNDLWLNLKKGIKNKIGYVNPRIRSSNFKTLDRQENVKLHGCCWVFSPIFLNSFDGLDPRTFMYCEEDILLAHLHRKNLLSVYNPELKIYHAEKLATKSETKNQRNQSIFIYTKGICSLKILEKILRDKK